jgi:hypothetical protein
VAKSFYHRALISKGYNHIGFKLSLETILSALDTEDVSAHAGKREEVAVLIGI